VLGNRIVSRRDLDKVCAEKSGAKDQLSSPVITDPSGLLANEVMAPGGWVAKIDVESEEWTGS